MGMHKMMLATVGAAAFAMASGASATVTPDACTFAACTYHTVGGTTTIGVEDAGLTANFTESVSFTNDLASTYSVTFGTSDAAVNFSSVALQMIGGATYDLLAGTNVGGIEQYYLPETQLGAGAYQLVATGTNANGGVASGTITITNMAAVPEPATWAMMLVGFGAVGFGMRRQRRSSAHLMQAA